MGARIILFDLGNVVVDWQPLHLYKKIFKTEQEAKAFCETICTMDWHIQHDLGVPMSQNAEHLIAKHPQYEAEIRAWRSRWLDMFVGYVEGMPALMARLEEARHPLYGLSNLSYEVAGETFDAFPMIKVLRDIVISGAEKCIKPNPKIYQIALRRMGRPNPGDVFFIDDRAENIEAAARLGMRGHVFTDAVSLERALVSEGFL
ncbi:MAG: HAD family phosphatase [Henriciella sp.]